MRTRLLLTLAAIFATTVIAEAGDAPPGRHVYVQYCGACHGPNGHGDGIAGSFMTVKPSDLTKIAERHGGRFEVMRVLRYIDGTEEVRAHGDPDMPVWGEIFRSQAAWDQTRRAEVRGKLLLITEYLQSIQATK
jgi:mono/diheme cytochrome c family protein